MQLPPVLWSPPRSEYNQIETEDQEWEVKEDSVGSPLPKEYWINWIILIGIAVVAIVILSVLYLF